jgi:hypothetical protein
MTKFGKALVLFNLVFSVLMAIWAIGVFANRVDFSNTKKPDQVLGLLAQREGRVKEVKDAFRPADAGWARARAAVYFQESFRPKLTAWYAEQLQNARDGNKEIGEVDMTKELARQRDAASFSPVVTGPSGLVFNPRFFEVPTMVAAKDAYGKPLRSLQVYSQEEQGLNKSIENERARYQKAIEEDVRQTALLIGREAALQKLGAEQANALLDAKLDSKGLRQRLQDERVKEQKLQEQIDFLKPLRVNVAVEHQLLQKRAQALEKRIEELKKIGVAVRP